MATLRFSLENFPGNHELHERSSLPWGCCLQPFAPIDSHLLTNIPHHGVARCNTCFAYINPYVYFSKNSYTCSLCNAHNAIPQRYSALDQRAELLELQSALLDLVMQDSDQASDSAEKTRNSRVDFPAYVFLVDLSGTPSCIDVVKSSILAALEALPPNAWIGLCSFSHKIGLYDLRSPVPHVRFCRIPPNGPCPLALEDVLPLSEFLVKLCDCKDNIVRAIETLTSQSFNNSSNIVNNGNNRGGFANGTPSDSKEGPSSIPVPAPYLQGDASDLEEAKASDGEHLSKNETSSVPSNQTGIHPINVPALHTSSEVRRGFGTTIESIITYLSADEYSLSVRVMTFLSGLPNYGEGRLVDRLARSSNDQDHDKDLLNPQTNFYRDLAAAAAKAGICFDLYALSDGKYMDLASVKFLTLMTGGNLLLYESSSNSTLPQDIYKQLERPQAFRGQLRLRTSPEFQLSTIYGHIIPDEHYENLFHLASCDSTKTLSADFVLASDVGFPSLSNAKPVVQMAFAYTSIERRVIQQEDGTQEQVERPVRRLRIYTQKLEIGRNLNAIYSMAMPPVMVNLLVQQIIQVTYEKGVAEARTLLEEWLINLIACYNQNLMTPKDISEQKFDLQFLRAPKLQFMSRFVYAILKNVLLRRDIKNPDSRVFYQCLYSGLETDFLIKALYPILTSFASVDKVGAQDLLLSRQHIDEDGNPLFLLDCYTGLYVYYRDAAANVPLPPPQQSELQKMVKRLKATSPLISPHIVFARAGTLAARYFDSYILEDEDSSKLSFNKFMDTVAKEVATRLRST